MSFTGNGGGRFQIRRIRNGSTTESFIFGNGPFQQDFAEPTGFHTPNWNIAGEGSFSAWSSTTAYSTGDFVKFGTADNEGVYTALQNSTNQSPTLNETNDYWEFEGLEGDPLILVPQLLVDGTTISLAGTRAASPVNAAITGVQWSVLANGAYEAVDTSQPGFGLYTSMEANMLESDTGDDVTVDTGTNSYLLGITRNLNLPGHFNDNALSEGRLYLRARISYNVTGVNEPDGTVITLMSDAFIVIQRVVLTESSMFSRILLVEQSGQPGSAAQIWNSGFTGNKRFRSDLIIGAAIHNDNASNPDHDVTYRWFDSDGEINQSSPPTGISFPTVGAEDSGRFMDVTRDAVDTAEVFYCIIREVTSDLSYTSNSIEIRDFLDPVQFIEQGTSSVAVGGNGRLTVLPYQNGSPMAGLEGVIPGTTTNKCEFNFTYRRLMSSEDSTGVSTAWLTSTDIATRFPGQSGGSYQSSDTIARTPYDATIQGATIVITNTELSTDGVFVDYDVTFDTVAN